MNTNATTRIFTLIAASIHLLLFTSIGPSPVLAQPQSLHPDITVVLYLNVNNTSSCLAFDKITNCIYYGNVTGNIYKVKEGTPNTDTLMYDTLDHNIPYVQGMTFHDSDLFIIGNDWTDGTQGIGMVRRGTLQSNGTRIWTTVLQTALYPATNATFDHGFSGIAVDPAGQYIYLSSGSRSDHGEIQTAGGLFPGIREVPLTSAIFRVPITAQNLSLPNNDTLLVQGGWLYADGTRNSFGLAFNGRGDLFGVENSGDRDDPEEMNRLQAGKHYGFPWKMGTNWTPQQFPGYNPNTDPLVNPNSKAYQMGFFYNDSTYPPAPSAITFTDPLDNLGPAANFYRDSSDGKIYQAIPQPLGTFTMHRAPVGLIFDSDSLLSFQFRGNGFMLSFTQGNGDSSGYLASSIWGLPVVPIDSSEDLIHLDMNYNQTNDTYTLNSKRIVEGFHLPVNAEMVDTIIYVLEYGSTGNRHIWKITMPGINTGISSPETTAYQLIAYPNPFSAQTTLEAGINLNNALLTVYNSLGQSVRQIKNISGKSISLQRGNLPAGLYFIRFTQAGKTVAAVKLVIADP